MKKIISVITILCFLMSSAGFAIDSNLSSVSGGINLAAPSEFDDLEGIETKDIGDIERWFTACLKYLDDKGLEITADNLKKFRDDIQYPGNSIFWNPDNTQFFVSEVKEVENNLLRVMVRREDEIYGTKRTYYVEFSSSNDVSAHPKGKSKERTKEDGEAIKRYKIHEDYDAFLAKLHKEGKIYDVTATSKSLYTFLIGSIKEILLAGFSHIENNALPLQDRKFYVAELTDEIEEELKQHKVRIIAEDGTTKDVVAYSHSSNNAIYIFFKPIAFHAFTQGSFPHKDEDIEELFQTLAHELGVVAGCPVLRFDASGRPINEMDEKYSEGLTRLAEEGKPFRMWHDVKGFYPGQTIHHMSGYKVFDLVDLNTNLRTRDYAAAGAEERAISLSEIAIVLLKLTSREFTCQELHYAFLNNDFWKYLDFPYIESETAIRIRLDRLVEEGVVKITNKDSRKRSEPYLYRVTKKHKSALEATVFHGLNLNLFGRRNEIDKIKMNNHKSGNRVIVFKSGKVVFVNPQGKAIATVDKSFDKYLPLMSFDGFSPDGRFVVLSLQKAGTENLPAADCTLAVYDLEAKNPKEPVMLYPEASLEKIWFYKNIVDKISASSNQIQEAKELVKSQEIIDNIPTHSDDQYTLVMDSNFFAKGEFDEHKKAYEDRFVLEQASARSEDNDTYVRNIIGKANVEKGRTIALVRHGLQTRHINELRKAGIRVIPATEDLRDFVKDSDLHDRRAFQQNTYMMMLLARRIDDMLTKNSAVYRMLDFYVRSHFYLEKGVTVEDYIQQAIIEGNVATLLKGVLMCMPAEEYRLPDQAVVGLEGLSA